MIESTYDVVIIGAGPAGLSAARTAARLGFKTLVLERLANLGRPVHACSMIGPVPRQAGLNPSGDLYFRKVDLTIPASAVSGYAARRSWLSPNGLAFAADLAGRGSGPAALVDTPALLGLLAERAGQAGAELRFGTEVTGLLQTSGRITGVRTRDDEIAAAVVMSAEGASREICRMVLPYQRLAGPERYGLIATQELTAPGVGAEHLGQLITLGHRYTSARSAIGMVLAPAPGRLTVSFCLVAGSPHHFTERSARFYLREYMYDDPRVRDLCSGAHVVGEHVTRFVAGSAPAHVTAAGFMGIGDSIAPGGYLGILPAIYLGRQAALVAAGSLDDDEPSAGRLALYDRLYRERILPDLNARYRAVADLMDLPDDELDACCGSLGGRRQAFASLTGALSAEWSTVGGRERRDPSLTGGMPARAAEPALAVLA